MTTQAGEGTESLKAIISKGQYEKTQKVICFVLRFRE